ncbi:Undecaprenyl-phosphate 4-deoxy-4-formamido-L-arabinose transferase [Roseobacter fucihabitans]|uniref:Undecaprenyl-phosphate 4-deoxy-4-formamido-L-arabinose transferase n=1 Tax=Roseobacter fucihabitans TaxID=1537242 RepID=A0ABZ2BYS1_9RHOB|nr:glycosyltransferase family 2 protein [Roseobacter litoralis]MBC6963806.1 putative glycosyltransferase EpsJ [Roseobacter litoralis]MBC6964109.1 putative glycosyltransferase EpsJ [Roseobacter litoralis]
MGLENVMHIPRVSIIMPAHNVEDFIGEAIGSIAAQAFSSFELIIVDDASTDGTAEVLRKAEELWPLRAEQLRIIHQANGGASSARNKGVAEAQGALLGFIDADDRWSPQTLAHLVAALDAFPESDIACPLYRRINEDGDEVNYLGERVDPRPLRHAETRQFNAGETLISTPAQSATGVIVRREAFLAGGGFDTALKSNNDVDCWLRILWTRQSMLVQCPQAVVDYRIRPAQITSDVRRMQRGHAQFLKNHQPLLRDIGLAARLRHLGLVRAYWALLAARHGDLGSALWYWFSAILLFPGLALPGTLGSSAAFAIAKAVLPTLFWQWISKLRRALKRKN